MSEQQDAVRENADAGPIDAAKYGCPKCSGMTRVTDSRVPAGRDKVRRRRRCVDCGYRFSTVELAVDEFDISAPHTLVENLLFKVSTLERYIVQLRQEIEALSLLGRAVRDVRRTEIEARRGDA